MKKVEIEKINIDSDDEEKAEKSKKSASRQPTVEKIKSGSVEDRHDEEMSQKSESQHLDSRF
jgi:hypothetical protein